MDKQQLAKIKLFSKPYYSDRKAGQFHDWRHIIMVLRAAEKLAYGNMLVDRHLLRAACYIHDIGRVVSDETHPVESMRIAAPFLAKIGLSQEEIDVIGDAVLNHGVENILSATTVEAKFLFDADKLQIVSLYGFIRVWGWLINERGMDMDEARIFLHGYVHATCEKYLQTERAREIATRELRKVDSMVSDWRKWNGFGYNRGILR